MAIISCIKVKIVYAKFYNCMIVSVILIKLLRFDFSESDMCKLYISQSSKHFVIRFKIVFRKIASDVSQIQFFSDSSEKIWEIVSLGKQKLLRYLNYDEKKRTGL